MVVVKLKDTHTECVVCVGYVIDVVVCGQYVGGGVGVWVELFKLCELYLLCELCSVLVCCW